MSPGLPPFKTAAASLPAFWPVLERLKAKAAEQNIEVAAAPAQRSADVLTAARSLGGKADVIFTSLDNNVVSSYESMYKASMELKIPLVASDADSVTRGAVAALGMDSFGTGQKAGRLAAAVLKGGNDAEYGAGVCGARGHGRFSFAERVKL